MKVFGFAFICGLALVGACGDNDIHGDDDGSGQVITPTASGVFPAQGFIGAQGLRIEISGDATAWTTGATVDFGAGVTVSNVAVASPTDLFADISIDPTATSGLHDVTVTSGGTFTLSQAFELQSPVGTTIIGDLVQGTVVQLTINNRNFDAPFDTSATPTLAGPTGTNFNILSNDEYTISAYMFVDVTAAAGPVTITAGALTENTDALAIMPRTPVTLTSGTAMNGTIADVRDSGLYTISNASGNLLHWSVSTTDASAEPFIALLPASGSWLDELSSTYDLGDAGAFYAIVADNEAYGGYTYSVTATSETTTVVAEGNDVTDGAKATAPLASSIPYEQIPSTLSSATDTDIIKFTVDAGHANMTLHILTNVDSDPATDTAVELVDSQDNDYLDDGFGDTTVDNDSDCDEFGDCSNLGEDVVSSALPAGTYYLEITKGGQYATTDKEYGALFWFE